MLIAPSPTRLSGTTTMEFTERFEFPREPFRLLWNYSKRKTGNVSLNFLRGVGESLSSGL
jgi:hypothetical protein